MDVDHGQDLAFDEFRDFLLLLPLNSLRNVFDTWAKSASLDLGDSVTIPDEIEAGQVCGQARALHPALPILARADMAGAEAHLRACGASRVVSAPREVAATLLAVAREPA